jgi:hypothetical protein
MASAEIERLNYFERQYLSWKDFLADQSYHIEMRRRHERSHHLWGIVFGLQITQDQVSKEWAVQPGMAVDAYGREMFVATPEPLDTTAIANYLAGQALPLNLKVWIAYDPEKSTPPAPGWQVCGAGTQYTRVDEGFQLLYKDVQDIFPLGDLPSTWPQVYNDLPDDAKTAPWPVYLGTVTWGPDPNNPATNTITAVNAPDPDQRDRRYIDIVAAEVLAPVQGIDGKGPGKIKMKSADLSLPDPLPAGNAGITVEIFGSLTVDRDVEIHGSLNVDQDATAHTLMTKSGHVVTKNPDGGLYIDSGPATAAKTAGVWFMSDQALGDDSTSTVLMRLTDAGNLGIGTQTPSSVLEINGDLALDQIASGAAKTLAANATMIWNDGSFLRLNENLDKSRLVNGVLVAGMLGVGTEKPNRPLSIVPIGGNQELVSFQDTSGNTVWHINQHLGGTSALNFVETNVADGRLFLQAGGNVGINTTSPRGTLDVNGSAWHLGRIGALNFPPDTGYPGGWGGGVHTWDLYAEGSVGAGGGGALAAVIDRNGFGKFTTSVQLGPINAPLTSINSGGDASFGGPVTVDRLLTPGQPDNGKGTVNCGTLNCGTVNCVTVNKIFNTFRIDHPLDASKHLVHAAMEGPENAVFYRGQAILAEGEATIELPDYFEALTHPTGRTVLLTPIYEKGSKVSQLASSEVTQGRFTVTAATRANPAQKFFWEVKAIRSDVTNLVVTQPKPAAKG